MRLAGLIAAAALFVPAVGAASQPQAVRTPAPVGLTLSAGETLLEVDATGSVMSRPDLVRLSVTAKSQAATSARARSMNEALIAKLTAAARGAGVAPADIRTGPNAWSRIGFVGNEAIEAGGVSFQTKEKTEIAAFEVRVRDFSRLDAIRSALEDAGAEQVGAPSFHLEDDSAARRAAQADAIRRARAEADDYANALGMRVVRILGVSERVPPYGTIDAMEGMLATMYGLGAPSAQEVQTTASVAVDFALAPR